MNNFNNVDLDITTILNEIGLISDNLTFREILRDEVQNLSIEKQDFRFKGIYLFEIKTDNQDTSFSEWLAMFKNNWEEDGFHRNWTPGLKKKRIACHQNLSEWMPIYLGKSKYVGSRLFDHLNHPPVINGNNTHIFSLKLLARENMKNATFRVSVIQIDVDNYDEIVARVETNLRNRINPIIGK